ncbi:thiamine-phosphate kinase [Rhodoblastus sp. 17X3]|uniref:thiamine-phosphate kinase n=1 Tax=Rhodoblastus sp. 17X3 TaxID=3047026 RepID=UPI0024B6BB40|nr:thiamine-phosphate kinase [Rhodoblastus sp. 17X3]MDI9849397.1 thiamine-phosphate kinase [Rhodoblastus sp. 17X3]
MNEAELIARYFAPLAGAGGLGLRDDAALLAPPPGAEIVVTADALIEGVHFFTADPPDRIAAKALAVNLSDLAAKAADPLGFLLTLALPRDWTPDWLESFALGLGEVSREFRCPLLGGDTVSTPGPLMLSITALGAVTAGKMTPRTGAKPGDALYVSGTIGDAALGLILRQAQIDGAPAPDWAAALSTSQQAWLVTRYLAPRARLPLVLALRACASAAMDVSDGLVGDLRAMMRASGASAKIDLRKAPQSEAVMAALRADSRLFERIFCGGDDYEVLCAVPTGAAARFEALAASAGVPVTTIGTVGPALTGDIFIGPDGEPVMFRQERFSHF